MFAIIWPSSVAMMIIDLKTTENMDAMVLKLMLYFQLGWVFPLNFDKNTAIPTSNTAAKTTARLSWIHPPD
jgi:hypothetical protein